MWSETQTTKCLEVGFLTGLPESPGQFFQCTPKLQNRNFRISPGENYILKKVWGICMYTWVERAKGTGHIKTVQPYLGLPDFSAKLVASGMSLLSLGLSFLILNKGQQYMCSAPSFFSLSGLSVLFRTTQIIGLSA